MAYDFGKTKRLLNAQDYDFVFSDSTRVGNRHFTVLARANQLGYPRLGMAISKKTAKRAVDRNRIKRVCRESFRHQFKHLPAVDIVVLSRHGIAELSLQALREGIDTQWHFIRKKFKAAATG